MIAVWVDPRGYVCVAADDFQPISLTPESAWRASVRIGEATAAAVKSAKNFDQHKPQYARSSKQFNPLEAITIESHILPGAEQSNSHDSHRAAMSIRLSTRRTHLPKRTNSVHFDEITPSQAGDLIYLLSKTATEAKRKAQR